jgi:hypothetical protein
MKLNKKQREDWEWFNAEEESFFKKLDQLVEQEHAYCGPAAHAMVRYAMYLSLQMPTKDAVFKMAFCDLWARYHAELSESKTVN